VLSSVNAICSCREGWQAVLLSHGNQVVGVHLEWVGALLVHSITDVGATDSIKVDVHRYVPVHSVAICVFKLGVDVLGEHTSENHALWVVVITKLLDKNSTNRGALISESRSKGRQWHANVVGIGCTGELQLEVVVPEALLSVAGTRLWQHAVAT